MKLSRGCEIVFLPCILRWYSFRFFQVQFSHKIFSVFNQIFLFSYSARWFWRLSLINQCKINFVKHSTAVLSQKVPFPQFGFTCLVLAYILWVLWQTLIYFRIYRKFCICNIIWDFPAFFGRIIRRNCIVLQDFRPKLCQKSAGLCFVNHYTQSFSVSCRATARLFGPFYI